MDNYPINGNPSYNLENQGNPYDADQPTNGQRGEPYTSNLAGRSTMVSDVVVMAERLKRFVPKASVKVGRLPEGNNLGYENSEEEWNEGKNYKAKYQ